MISVLALQGSLLAALDLPTDQLIFLLDLLFVFYQLTVRLDLRTQVAVRFQLFLQHLSVSLVLSVKILQRLLQKLAIFRKAGLSRDKIGLLFFSFFVDVRDHLVHLAPLLTQRSQFCLVLFPDECQVDPFQLLLLLFADALKESPLTLELLDGWAVRLDFLGVFFA